MKVVHMICMTKSKDVIHSSPFSDLLNKCELTTESVRAIISEQIRIVNHLFSPMCELDQLDH